MDIMHGPGLPGLLKTEDWCCEGDRKLLSASPVFQGECIVFVHWGASSGHWVVAHYKPGQSEWYWGQYFTNVDNAWTAFASKSRTLMMNYKAYCAHIHEQNEMDARAINRRGED